jgi:DNA (cytosine-5)-methyltransferase 1
MCIRIARVLMWLRGSRLRDFSINRRHMQPLKVLDLFSGIGGFSLGLEKTQGFETVAFCEIDEKAQRVLKKHWANVPIYPDVSTLKGSDLGTIDVICGGFPCQDISLAGKGAGLEGERSGLWWEFHRLIKETKPKFVIIENVSALRSRGLDQVLRSLSEIGYDAEWHCLPASSVGAPHQRDRIWIISYPHRDDGGSWDCSEPPDRQAWVESRCSSKGLLESHTTQEMAYPHNTGSQGRVSWRTGTERETELGYLGRCRTVDGQPIEDFWSTEPNVGRVAHGVSNRVDRLKQLGNAVVPQIPELIGNAILNGTGR